MTGRRRAIAGGNITRRTSTDGRGAASLSHWTSITKFPPYPLPHTHLRPGRSPTVYSGRYCGDRTRSRVSLYLRDNITRRCRRTAPTLAWRPIRGGLLALELLTKGHLPRVTRSWLGYCGCRYSSTVVFSASPGVVAVGLGRHRRVPSADNHERRASQYGVVGTDRLPSAQPTGPSRGLFSFCLTCA